MVSEEVTSELKLNNNRRDNRDQVCNMYGCHVAIVNRDELS